MLTIFLIRTGWLLQMQAESVARRVRSEVRFEDQACRELGFCVKWVDPIEVKRITVEKTVDAVFS